MASISALFILDSSKNRLGYLPHLYNLHYRQQYHSRHYHQQCHTRHHLLQTLFAYCLIGHCSDPSNLQASFQQPSHLNLMQLQCLHHHHLLHFLWYYHNYDMQDFPVGMLCLQERPWRWVYDQKIQFDDDGRDRLGVVGSSRKCKGG